MKVPLELLEVLVLLVLLVLLVSLVPLVLAVTFLILMILLVDSSTCYFAFSHASAVRCIALLAIHKSTQIGS